VPALGCRLRVTRAAAAHHAPHCWIHLLRFEVVVDVEDSPATKTKVDGKAFIDQKPHDTAMVSSLRRAVSWLLIAPGLLAAVRARGAPPARAS
jgi:hypothetical protein